MLTLSTGISMEPEDIKWKTMTHLKNIKLKKKKNQQRLAKGKGPL